MPALDHTFHQSAYKMQNHHKQKNKEIVNLKRTKIVEVLLLKQNR